MNFRATKFNISVFTTLILLFIISVSFAQIQRYSGEKLTGNHNWRGTIIIAGDVTLGSNCRLVIEPGTKILFEQNKDLSKSGSDKTRCELIVRGTLIARGLPGKKITFSSKASSRRMGDWYGVQFLHLKSGSLLEYCVIEYAYNGITIKNSNMQVNNCEIRYNYHAGIRTEVKAKPTISNNILSENGYAGLICELGAKPIVTNNLISLNRIGVVVFSLSQPNLGSLASNENYNPGQNKIFNNEEYNFYNHSSKPILAENNFWGSENLVAIADKVYDNADNTKYGEIDYEPFSKESRQTGLGNLLLLAQNTESEIPPSPLDSETILQTANTQNPEQLSDARPANSDSIKGDLSPDNPAIPESSDDMANLFNVLTDATPLIASTGPIQPEVENLPISNTDVAAQIDYDQTFLELFLDGGKKEYDKKPKMKITNVLRNVLRKGEIRVKVIVNKYGGVQSASILRGINEILDQAVLATIQKYQYQPGTVNGQSVSFTTSEVFRFK